MKSRAIVPPRRWLALALMVLAALAFSSCGEDEADSAPSPSEPAAATAAAGGDEWAPTIDEKFRVGSPKQQLAIRCWGSGKPAVVLDAGSGSGGIETFGALQEDLIKPLARRSTVCTYDRAGAGATAVLPQKRRTIDDQAEELDALLTAAGAPKPRVLVGSSWGGFVAVHTARNYPEAVGGIVLLDVPAGNPHLTAEEAPDAAWDHPANIERVDSFDAERTMARDKRSLGDLPVTVVTADGGQSDKRDQQSWKRLSSNFSQVVLSGGHDIYLDDPERVLEQIQKAVNAAG
jgi:surfactin synthase thioesterase subunit